MSGHQTPVRWPRQIQHSCVVARTSRQATLGGLSQRVVSSHPSVLCTAATTKAEVDMYHLQVPSIQGYPYEPWMILESRLQREVRRQRRARARQDRRSRGRR